jgi:signal transduction histidine kinase
MTLAARGRTGAVLGWPDASADLAASAEGRRRAAVLAPAEAPAREAVSLSLADRFPRVLDAGRRIASALTREAILVAVQDAAVALLRGERCEVHAITEDASCYVPPAGLGLSPGTVRRALEGGKAVVSTEGLETDESDSIILSEARSTLCAPVFVRDRAAAFFYVTHERVGGLFGPVEERLAEFIAAIAGAALENAENFAQVDALSRERERLYVEAQTAVLERDDFLSVASHELKTPLTSLWLSVQLLEKNGREGTVLGVRDVARISTIVKQSRRLGQLMDDLLDISRITHGQLALEREDVDLRGVVDAVVARLTEEAAAVRCAVAIEGPGAVHGQWDRARLDQVVTNLFTNAMKFGAGAPILIAVEFDPSDPEVARLSVTDRGVGISLADQDRIFERFERAVPIRHFGGFGLGLWIVRQIVDALHGTIRVESRPGEGARFVVDLPRNPPALH